MARKEADEKRLQFARAPVRVHNEGRHDHLTSNARLAVKALPVGND